MARPVWTGSISFGLVNLPVKLYSAVEDHSVRFHNFERGSGERIRHRRVAEDSGHEVGYDDIVKGYEIRPGEHVIVEQEELEAVEPGRSRSVEIEDFVDLASVDPVHFDRTYYLAPADEGAARAYRLLQTVLDDAGKVGVARFAMRGKQHLAAVRPLDGVLAIETMHFADEVRDPKALDGIDLVEAVEVGDRELDAARQLVDSLSTEWDLEEYEDTYRQRVLELIERKAEGESVVVDEPEESGGQVLDLMAALEASVSEAKQRRAGTAGEFDDMTRDELYEEAQRRDIDGRSSMSKPELLRALKQAS